MVATLNPDGSEIFIDGPSYLSVFSAIYAYVRPQTYFEIGTQFGDTLRLSNCKTVAVDPNFQISDELRHQPHLLLRQTTSDEYFARHNPVEDLGQRVDFAFIDGMHEFEYVLRDFINLEKYCSKRAIIAMHDCVPLDNHMTRRFSNYHEKGPTNHPNFWTGDVWKIVPILRQYRPDLDLQCLDSVATGLAVCRNFDPGNTVLEQNYDAIVSAWTGVTLKQYGLRKFLEVADVQSAAAWVETIKPAYLSLTNRARRLLRPRRRLQALARLFTPAARKAS